MRRLRYPLTARMAVHADALGLLWPQAQAGTTIESNVAVLDIEGPLEHRGGGWWFQSYESTLRDLRDLLAKDEVHGVVLRLASPGGDFAGMIEASRQMRALARAAGKPLVAAVDEEACSAAYCLASAADHIVVPPSGVVGSIGVLARIGDRTAANEEAGLNIKVIGSGKYKGELHPDRPLSNEATKRVQAEVDDLGRMFAEVVAEHRGLSVEHVLGQEADTFRGQEAIDAGLADELGALPVALEACRQRAEKARATATQAAPAGATRTPSQTTAARPQPTRTAMNRELLCRLLGLASTATDAEINEAMAAMGATHAQLLALAQGATTVPDAVGKLGATMQRLAALEASAAENEEKARKATAEAEVGKLVADKRLQPSMKAFALSIYGTASWASFVAGLPGGTTTAGAPATAVNAARTPADGTPPPTTRGRAFDERELATLQRLGLTAEEAQAALAKAKREGDDFNQEGF